MSLRKKVLWVLGVTFALAMIGNIELTRSIVITDYQQLEKQYATTNVNRAWAALEDEIARIAMVAGDWAQWDDTRDFVLGKKPEYTASNLTDSALATIQANLLMYWNVAGTLVSAKGVNLKDKTDWPIPATVNQAIVNQRQLFDLHEVSDLKTGVIHTSEGPLLIASRPITSSAVEPPIYGTLVVGRFLEEALLSKLARQTQLDLCIADRTAIREAGTEKALRELTESNPKAIVIEDSEQLIGYHVICDLAERNNLVLQVHMPRDIVNQGMASVRFFLVSLGWVGFLVCVILWFLLQILVLNPLHRLADHLSTLRQTQDLTSQIAVSSSDEMGTLTREFNELTSQLYQARKQLNDQAFWSGMSEMASGVLHNLRNALTPITTEIESLCQQVEQVPVQRLRQAINELASPATEPDRKEKLTRFVDSGRDAMIDLIAQIHGHLEGISQPMAQVDQILADQQQFCSNPSTMDHVKPAELIQDALTLIGTERLGPAEVILNPSLDTIGPIPMARIQMVQVLSNLLINAGESIRMTRRSQGHIVLDAILETKDSVSVCHLRVRDDGNGFSPEVQNRLFERGFSTKGKSNWGLGLHWCSTVLNGMHGRIYAESDGPGKGATFHVEWPVEVPENGRMI
ncbi:MAG: HAMP domain-containing protein [Phycisphaerae bacterium]|nr:HAMP domain-containing protein [Phycisphaerae bacterium]